MRSLWTIKDPCQSRYVTEGTAACGGPLPEQRKPLRRKAQWKKKSKEQVAAERNPYVVTPTSFNAHCLNKGTEGSGDKEKGRRHVWSEVEHGTGGEKAFSLSV